MHYLLLISDNEQMCFQAELLIRSIMHFSPKDIKNNFSVVVNGNKSGPLGKSVELSKYRLNNNFINNIAEVLYCEYHWLVPTPSRWFITPQDKTCVFIDVDIVACKDLSSFYELKDNCIYGVAALKIPMSNFEWSQLGFNQNKDFINYLNFGMLVIPSNLMSKIGLRLIENLPIILKKFKRYEYFAAQIALAYVFKNLDVPKVILPQIFNFFDTNETLDDLDNVLLLHYMKNRKFFKNLETSYDVQENEITKKISSVVKLLYNKY